MRNETLDASRKNAYGDPLPRLAFKDAPESEAVRGWTEAHLRGLFAEARQSGDLATARGFAEKALKLNPALAPAYDDGRPRK